MAEEKPSEVEVRLLAWVLGAQGVLLILQDRAGSAYLVPTSLGARLGKPLTLAELKQVRQEIDEDKEARFLVRFDNSQYVPVSDLVALLGPPAEGITDQEIDTMVSLSGPPPLLGG